MTGQISKVVDKASESEEDALAFAALVRNAQLRVQGHWRLWEAFGCSCAFGQTFDLFALVATFREQLTATHFAEFICRYTET